MLLAALIGVVGWVALRRHQSANAAKVEAKRARASEEMAKAQAQRADQRIPPASGLLTPYPALAVLTNYGPLLVVDLWSLLNPMCHPRTDQSQVEQAAVLCNSCHDNPPTRTVRFQGPPVDVSVLSQSERSATRFLLVPSTSGMPRAMWPAQDVQNLRAAGFLFPDAEAAEQAAEQLKAL